LLRVQRLATGIVRRVLDGRNLDEALAEIRRRESDLSAAERGALQDLSFGTLRFLGRLSALRSHFVAKAIPDAAVGCLLLIALYQLIYTKAPAYAVVDSAVEAARAFSGEKLGRLVNAVLRRFLREGQHAIESIDTNEVANFSYPQWWIDKVKGACGPQWEAVLRAGNSHPPLTLRLNRRRASLSEYVNTLQAQNIAHRVLGDSAVQILEPRPVERIPGFADGLVSVQDAAAQHAAPLLDVRDGMKVLDACAAPGGKACHLLESADVELTAIDKSRARLSKVASNLSRLGLQANVVAADAADLSRWWNGAPFDRILLDAPCTASGVVKRHPDIKWLRRHEDVTAFARQQGRLLEALWQALGKGGKLLYVTCSVFPEENHEQTAAFRDRHADAVCVPLTSLGDGCGRLLPNDVGDGFYYALFAKR
jgi:16S rRNA (cytosine967-C5)-methyltransferase